MYALHGPTKTLLTIHHEDSTANILTGRVMLHIRSTASSTAMLGGPSLGNVSDMSMSLQFAYDVRPLSYEQTQEEGHGS